MAQNTIYELFLYIVIPIVGIGLMVFALGWGWRLGQRPVEIAIAKLGLNFKADILTLLVLLGFVMAGAGAFFWYRGYEFRLADLQGKLAQMQTKMNNMDEVLQSFKVYDLRLHLIFPDQVDVRRTKVQVYITKQGRGSPQLSAPETDIGVANDLWVKLDSLNRGDKLRIVAYEGNEKTWESAHMEIPKTQVQMTRVR